MKCLNIIHIWMLLWGNTTSMLATFYLLFTFFVLLNVLENTPFALLYKNDLNHAPFFYYFS